MVAVFVFLGVSFFWFVAAGFRSSSESISCVVLCVVVSCWCRSGVVGGVGCLRIRATLVISGVIAVAVALAVGADIWLLGVGCSAKVNFVCRTTFGSVSFAFDTLFCLDFSPRLGEGLLPLAPLGLRRFWCRVMVDYFA